MRTKMFCFFIVSYARYTFAVVVMIQKNDFALIFHLINDDIKGNCGAYCVRPFQLLMIMNERWREGRVFFKV